MIRLILSLFLLVSSAYADYGIDSLGLPKFKNELIKALPQGWWFGTFAETFDDAYPAVEDVIKSGKPKGYRVQLIWSDTHSFSDKDIPKIVSLSKKYNQLAVKYPSVKCELSPFCEHNVKNPDKYLDIVKQHAPNCEPVNTVWQGALSNKYKNEIHGNKKAAPRGRYNFSYDGQSAVDANVEADKSKYSSAEVFFLWAPQANGKLKMEDKTPRPERKAWANEKQIRSWAYLGQNSKGQTSLPAKWILKSHSDQHTVPPSGKDQKPVLISPVKTSSFSCVADNGAVIEKLSYFGSFEGGGYRYYAPNWGFEIAEKAKKVHGKGTCKLVADRKNYGTINPAFRENSYR